MTRAFLRLILLPYSIVVASAQQPWWDNYPRIVHFMNQPCGVRAGAKAQTLNADVAACSSVADPNVGIWGQRIVIREESEPDALAKMHAAGLRTQAYFEAFGQAKSFVVEVRKNPDGSWMKDKDDPELTRRFLNHWNWDRFDGKGEIRWTGVHSYFGDEDFARPFTLTHPRYGSPPVRYPDGRIAAGYSGPATDPRNSLVYDACAVKDVNGNLYMDYSYNRAVARRQGPYEGLLRVGAQYSGNFEIGKDAACPSWIDYARASVLQALDFGLDSMYTDNFSPWDSFGFDPVKKAFGEWSVATFRDYLAAHFKREQLAAIGVRDVKTFDVRVYLRTMAGQFGGTSSDQPANLEDSVWRNVRWLDDPIWRAYKIHRRQNGTQALAAYYREVKNAAASVGKPDFPVTANDFQGFNLGWARGDLDMVNSEILYTESKPLASGRYGYMLPPAGSYVAVYKKALEQARGRLGIFWLYVTPDLVGHPAIADVLQYQALANHVLPEPWTGVARPQTAGTDATTAAFNAFLGSARLTFGERKGLEEIGLYYSSSSEVAALTLNGWGDRSRGPAHTLSFQAWGTALSWLHEQWRAIPEWKLNANTLTSLKLLIIPSAEVFDPADVAVLKDWIARGGKLIVAGRSGFRDGEKANFDLLTRSSLQNLGRHLSEDPGPAFTNTKDDRLERLPIFAAALRDAGFTGMVAARDVPYTIGITLYHDVKTHRRFVDINNTDIDVATDTLHPAPPLHFEVAVDAMDVEAAVLTPDGPGVKVRVKPVRDHVVAIDVEGVQRYASIVLKPTSAALLKKLAQ